jgi:hypothetical protein
MPSRNHPVPRLTVPTVASPVPAPAGPPLGRLGVLGVLLVWAGWIVVLWGFFGLQDFQFPAKLYYTLSPKVSLDAVRQAVLIGSFLAIVGFLILPERDTSDLSRRTAWTWLAVILAVAAWQVFYGYDRPMGHVWDDWTINVTDARNVIDRQRYSIIFRIGGREPFFVYLISFLWFLFPALKGMVIQRMASAVIYFAGIWLMYRLGAELRSRRTGVLLAAAGAAGKPFLLMSLTGMPIGGVVLGVAWALIALIRIDRNPKMSHFLLWGLGMAFGTYTYPAFRPWPLLVPAIVLAWILLHRAERRLDWHTLLLPLQVFWLLIAYFYRYHLSILGKFPLFETVLKAWDQDPALRSVFFVILAVTVAKGLAVRERSAGGVRLMGWTLGTLLMLVLIWPLTTDEEFYSRVASYSVFTGGDFKAGGLAYLVSKLRIALRIMYSNADDRDDLDVGQEPFFEHMTLAVTLLGFLWFLGRMSRRAWLLFGVAAFSLIPHVLSSDTATTKTMGALVPLLALGALGLETLLTASQSLGRRVRLGWLPVLLVLAMFAAGAYQSFFKLHRLWATEYQPNALTALEIEKALERGEKVYIAAQGQFWGETTMSVLNQGRIYTALFDPTAFELGRGETPPTVCVLMSATSTEFMAALRKSCPGAQWTRIDVPSLVPNRRWEGIMWRVTLPPGTIPETPTGPLYIRRVDGKPWHRRYTCWHFGNGLGVTYLEDRAARVGDPVDGAKLLAEPFNYHDGLNHMFVTGKFKADAAGVYEWVVTSTRRTWITVDGRLLADLDPKKVGSGDQGVKVALSPGEHDFEYHVNFAGKFEVPPIRLRRPGSAVLEAF